MLPYWLFFLIPAVGVLSTRRLAPSAQLWVWLLVGGGFALAIGLRHQVGGDWYAYLHHLTLRGNMGFIEILQEGDPGYYLINWLAFFLPGGIYWVNFVCGAILMAGVVNFARNQPLPWLALLVAVPYLITVVGMGYTRQSAALGLVMLGLVALSHQQLRWFIVWVLVGATFHKSAVLILPVAALATTQHKGWSVFWVGVMSLLGGYLFVFDSADQLWQNYVEADYQSQGGLIRVMMNAVPAVLFLSLQRYLKLPYEEKALWSWLSILAIICIPLVILSSTATDRAALYLIPLQLYVFSRLHLLTSDTRTRAYIVIAILAYYALVHFVWLNFATHAFAWLPYQAVWFI